MLNADGVEYTSLWAVRCTRDGLVSLTGAQFQNQLEHPDDLWFCPICGQRARWDDDCPLSNPPEVNPDGADPEGNQSGREYEEDHN